MNRLYPTRPFLAASVAVFRGPEVLLARRSRPPAAGLYSLPGGLVEPGEGLAEAALRELSEEVGVVAKIVCFNDHVEIIDRDGEGRVSAHFVVASFVGAWLEGEAVVGAEAADVAWVLPEAADGLPHTPGLPAILARACTLLAAHR